METVLQICSDITFGGSNRSMILTDEILKQRLQPFMAYIFKQSKNSYAVISKEDFIKMKKIFLFLFCILIQNCYSSETKLDTVILRTEKIKGFGPFYKGVTEYHHYSNIESVLNFVPYLNNIPSDLSNKTYLVIPLDLAQSKYQQYKNDKITKSKYDEIFNNFHFDSTVLSNNFINVHSVIVAGFDKSNNLIAIIDQNNNLDFNDDKRICLTPPLEFKAFWNLDFVQYLYPVEYDLFIGKHKKKEKFYLFLNRFYKSKYRSDTDIRLAIIRGEYRTTQFYIGDELYKIIMINNHLGAFRGLGYGIALLPGDKNRKLDDGQLVKPGESIVFGSSRFRFLGATCDGEYIRLIDEDNAINDPGHQIGMKALNIRAQTISGEKISIDNFKGKYIYLDFWGTYCSGCIKEMPELKKIYKTYKSKNFIMLGIASDTLERLTKYIQKNDIDWPQILMNNEIMKTYNIISYPTTFLIDPDGIIIDRNISAEKLAEKLEQIF